jgi:hypothetical protein
MKARTKQLQNGLSLVQAAAHSVSELSPMPTAALVLALQQLATVAGAAAMTVRLMLTVEEAEALAKAESQLLETETKRTRGGGKN